MTGTSAPDADGLWRTTSEPEIDAGLADGLRANQDFARWWVRQVLQGIELEEIVETKPNFTREQKFWFAQSSSGREADLHMVVKDKAGDRYAILTESKIVAPYSQCQPQDYSVDAGGVEREGMWIKSVTVLMSPADYLLRHRSVKRYDTSISYELVLEAAQAQGLDDLAPFILAGITRSEHAGGAPRNPDDLIGGFRVQYTDLLQEENRQPFDCLQGSDRKSFDSSQRWLDFCPNQTLLGRSGVRSIHQICNHNKSTQDHSRTQVLSVQVTRTNHTQYCPPRFSESDEWRYTSKYWFEDISMSPEAWLLFEGFDRDAARRVWSQISTSLKDISRMPLILKLVRDAELPSLCTFTRALTSPNHSDLCTPPLNS